MREIWYIVLHDYSAYVLSDGSQVIYLAKPDEPLKKITLADNFEDIRENGTLTHELS